MGGIAIDAQWKRATKLLLKDDLEDFSSKKRVLSPGKNFFVKKNTFVLD
jgi:hypothetical protein